ncbi:uncharacterized protein [Anabrus simplex]|uniref:uncharacterized protein n=1 Tax=Anabrus simplex TaxID=316456 RepID=UPI0035A3A4D8
MLGIQSTPWTENLPRQVPQVWFVDREEPPRNGRTETFSHPGQDSIHRSMTSLLVTAQLFGLMPVQGITAPSPSRLRFHWRSLRVLYCLVVLVCSIILLGISCARLARIGVTFPRTAGTLFFVVHILAIVLFLQLARRWPHLMWEWARVESAFTHYGPPPRLARTFRAVTATVMLAALVEHLLSNAKSLRTFYFLCPDNWVRLFASSHYHAFEVVPYAPLWIPVFALFNLLSTFSWSYVDVFLMLLSVGVSARFRQLNRLTRFASRNFLPELLWRQLREDYNSLSYLTKTVDSCVSKLVLLSFGNNLYFICVQLLNSMKFTNTKPSTASRSRFTLSDIFKPPSFDSARSDSEPTLTDVNKPTSVQGRVANGAVESSKDSNINPTTPGSSHDNRLEHMDIVNTPVLKADSQDIANAPAGDQLPLASNDSTDSDIVSVEETLDIKDMHVSDQGTIEENNAIANTLRQEDQQLDTMPITLQPLRRSEAESQRPPESTLSLIRCHDPHTTVGTVNFNNKSTTTQMYSLLKFLQCHDIDLVMLQEVSINYFSSVLNYNAYVNTGSDNVGTAILTNPMSPNLLDAVYFYWSFGYLLLKTCAVSLLAADIFDRSKEPKTLLYSVPPESYCEEVERFLAQVVSDDVALTGLNFFSVTRTLLLTVAGTIVTYEIVLVQFNNLGESDEPTQASNETIMACREG